MDKKIRDFFLSLENPNFLAIKLLLDVFEKMKVSDESSKKIVDNIHVLSPYNIKFIYSRDSFSYVFSEDDLSKIEYAISSCGSKYTACHEFGHLLLDIFFRGEVPEEFFKVNEGCKKRLMDGEEFVSSLLQNYRDETFLKLMSEITDPLGFYDRHPEFREEYLKTHPEADEREMINDVIIEHFSLISAFDEKIDNYNRVANVIDGIFAGDNPFYLDYGNDQVDPILSFHQDEYFTEDDNGPEVAGFEEQFADYLVLRVYHYEMIEAVNTLHNLIGREWFEMMDNCYEKIASKVAESGKVYEYKKS